VILATCKARTFINIRDEAIIRLSATLACGWRRSRA